MHILVTGGCGFIGRRLVTRLAGDGHTGLVVDDLSTSFRWASMPSGWAFREGKVSDWIPEQVDAIYHLGAAVGVSHVVERAADSLVDHVRDAQIIADQAQHNNCPALFASSSEVYGRSCNGRDDVDGTVPHRWWRVTEQVPPRISPHMERSTYAIGKLAAERLLRLCCPQSIVVRLFNVAGAGQRLAMVLPRMVKDALVHRKIVVYGDGGQLRCFVHVDDVVDVFVRLMQVRAHGVFNVGSSAAPVCMRDLAAHVALAVYRATGIHVEVVHEAYKLGEDRSWHHCRVPNVGLLCHVIGEWHIRSLAYIVNEVVESMIEQSEVTNERVVSGG